MSPLSSDEDLNPQALADDAAADTGSGNALPPGTMLGEFELMAVAGEGGFAIVYRAWDHSLKRQVALKEYLPATLAMRNGGLQVMVKPGRQSEAFWKGLQSFVLEAQLLAQFDHPALVKVFRFWEANGSAYMVMPFYEGKTLRAELQSRDQPPDEATLLGWLAPVADALSVIHAEHWYHRDVAPDNILLLAGTGRPLLLDFGAARRVIGDMTQALTVILKPGYAPIEQYTDIPGVHQGPWTDIYALAAVAHFAICGKTPPPSVGRMLTDSYLPLAQLAAGRYSDKLLRAIDRALDVQPKGRPQSIAEFKQATGMADLPVITQQHPASQPMLPTRDSLTLNASPAPAPRAAPPVAAPTPWPAVPLAAPAAAPVAARMPRPVAPSAAAQAVPVVAADLHDATGPAPVRRGLLLGAGAAALVLAAGGTWWIGRRAASPAAPAAAAPDAAASRLAAAQPAAPATAPAAAPMSAPTSVPSSTAAAAALDVVAEFDRVVQAQTPGWGLDVALDRNQLRMDRDKLVFTLRSLQAGYVYVFHHSSDGGLQQLYPNSHAAAPQIGKGSVLKLPQGRLDFNVGGPPGPSQLLVLVSRWPREHAAAAPREDGGFLAFATDAAAATRAAAAAKAGLPLLAGRPVCQAGAACADAYGAAAVAFDVLR